MSFDIGQPTEQITTRTLGNMSANQSPHVRSLVLDATPLITQSYTHYQNYAESFYTTPTVFHEIKDAQARKNLAIWEDLGTLKLRHPSASSIKRVSDFAKLTGDFFVLSANDIHILALAYELETELNKGDWRLRKKPGDSLDHLEKLETKEEEEKLETVDQEQKKKKRRRGGKKQKAKREAAAAAAAATAAAGTADETIPQDSGVPDQVQQAPSEDFTSPKSPPSEARDQKEDDKVEEIRKLIDETVLSEQDQEEMQKDAQEVVEFDGEYKEEDDDGDWITPENLTESMIRDSGEDTTGSSGVLATEESRAVALNSPKNQVALATGDFAIQNVALQMNLNLMNFMSGLRIKRLRNYMLRCHACFKLFPIPRNGKSKHFCSSCGGYSTLIRCAVSVDAETGEITPHLKANFQWNNRGNKYSLSSPLSKNSQKRMGNKGFVHTKHPQDVVILREDQKEYQQALKQEEWTKRHNEKVLNNWIGGGSADNYMSPFAISGLKQHSVRVGKGRYVNSTKKRV